jgi:hypothetical protein
VEFFYAKFLKNENEKIKKKPPNPVEGSEVLRVDHA